MVQEDTAQAFYRKARAEGLPFPRQLPYRDYLEVTDSIMYGFDNTDGNRGREFVTALCYVGERRAFYKVGLYATELGRQAFQFSKQNIGWGLSTIDESYSSDFPMGSVVSLYRA